MNRIVALLFCLFYAGCSANSGGDAPGRAQDSPEDSVANIESAFSTCSTTSSSTILNGTVDNLLCDGVACVRTCSNADPTRCSTKCQNGPQPPRTQPIFDLSVLRPDCQITPNSRVNAGFASITKNECEARGNCWDTRTTDAAIPWCFEPLGKQPTCGAMAPSARINAGYPGIPATTCVRTRGACWDDRVPAVPWCFQPTRTMATVMRGDLDNPYQAFVGDLNFDGQRDLYIALRPQNVTVDGSVPTTNPHLLPELVLLNNGRGSFTPVAPNASQLAQLATWQASAVQLTLRDVDLDGREDIETVGLKTNIPGTFDQILYAENAGQLPVRMTTQTEKFDKYHADLVQWAINPRYFQDSIFKRVVGAEPARKTWVGSVRNASNLALVSILSNWCSAAFPNNVCGVSSQPPPNCIMTVQTLGPTGESLGVETVNVCNDPFHVYVYVPGQVTLQPDTSATDADARGTAEILDSFNRNCDAIDPDADRRIGDRVRSVYGSAIRSPLSNILNNSIGHPAVAGDELFDRSEVTFHHYDVRTQVCEFGGPNCNVTTIENEIFRQFTYPAKRLQPTFTSVDNVETLTAYITFPGQTEIAAAYTWPAGSIKQRRLVSPGFLQGGFQNITQSNHLVFPGLITRKVRQNSHGIEIFTHGIGFNRAFCTDQRALSSINVIIALSNDRFGAAAFRQLDRELVKYYQRFYFIPFPPSPGSNVGIVDMSGTRVQPGTAAAP